MEFPSSHAGHAATLQAAWPATPYMPHNSIYTLIIDYTLKWFNMCRIYTVCIYIFTHICIYIYLFNWFVYYIIFDIVYWCLLIGSFIHYHVFIIHICNSMWRHSARRSEDHHLLLFNGPRSETHTISRWPFWTWASVSASSQGLHSPIAAWLPQCLDVASEGAPKKTRLTFES